MPLTRGQVDMKHKLEEHGNKCDRPGCCPICDGGLSNCLVCRGAESSLPTECPGIPMTHEQQDSVTSGTLDYIKGNWKTIKNRNVNHG